MKVQKTTDHLGQYMTLDGAARALDVSYNKLVMYMRRHNVPVLKLGGRMTLVRLIDLKGLLRDA